MAIERFDNVGQFGILADIPAWDMPKNAWTEGSNVRFTDNAIEKFKGQRDAFGALSIAPYYATFIQDSANVYCVYADLSAVYATDQAAHANITSAGSGFSATTSLLWNGGNLNGVLIMNEGSVAPHQWVPSLGNKLQPLSNWPALTSCKMIRPFGYFLVAMDVTENGVRNQRLIRWSHPAAPGAVPASWDYTDPNYDAGRTELGEGSESLIDCLPLREFNLIYREHSCYAQQYIGGNQVFQFRSLFSQLGILSPRCVVSFEGYHVVFADGDIVQHDMQSVRSLLDRRLRSWVFSSIDPLYYSRSYIAPNYSKNEMWFCFPQEGYQWPNVAVVWNWRQDTVYIRDIPNSPHIAYGIVNPGGDTTFDSATGSFDADSDAFDYRNYNPTQDSLLIVDLANSRLLQADNGETFGTADMYAYVQRHAVPLGDPKNVTSMKKVTRVIPKIDGTPGEIVNISIGTADALDAPITWSAPKPFIIGTDWFVNSRERGRIIDIKFEYRGSGTFRLVGYDIDFDYVGIR